MTTLKKFEIETICVDGTYEGYLITIDGKKEFITNSDLLRSKINSVLDEICTCTCTISGIGVKQVTDDNKIEDIVTDTNLDNKPDNKTPEEDRKIEDKGAFKEDLKDVFTQADLRIDESIVAKPEPEPEFILTEHSEAKKLKTAHMLRKKEIGDSTIRISGDFARLTRRRYLDTISARLSDFKKLVQLNKDEIAEAITGFHDTKKVMLRKFAQEVNTNLDFFNELETSEKLEPIPVHCPLCNGINTRKNGQNKKKQDKFWCYDCSLSFKEGDGYGQKPLTPIKCPNCGHDECITWGEQRIDSDKRTKLICKTCKKTFSYHLPLETDFKIQEIEIDIDFSKVESKLCGKTEIRQVGNVIQLQRKGYHNRVIITVEDLERLNELDAKKFSDTISNLSEAKRLILRKYSTECRKIKLMKEAESALKTEQELSNANVCKAVFESALQKPVDKSAKIDIVIADVDEGEGEITQPETPIEPEIPPVEQDILKQAKEYIELLGKANSKMIASSLKISEALVVRILEKNQAQIDVWKEQFEDSKYLRKLRTDTRIGGKEHDNGNLSIEST